MEDRGLSLLLAGISALLFVRLVLNVLNAVCRRGGRGARHGVLQGVGTLFSSVFLLRLSVAVWARGHIAPEGFSELGWMYGAGGLDLLADSFIHALQTFSLDEDYALYLGAGRLFLGEGFAYGLYRLVADATAAAAPICGGAIIFNLLCRIFPHARYALLERSEKRYVFTQLNERSLKLARSIRAEEPDARPGLFEDYKTYDAKLLRLISQNMIRYLADAAEGDAAVCAETNKTEALQEEERLK